MKCIREPLPFQFVVSHRMACAVVVVKFLSQIYWSCALQGNLRMSYCMQDADKALRNSMLSCMLLAAA